MRAIIALVAGGAAVLVGIGVLILGTAWLVGLVVLVATALASTGLEPGAWLSVIVDLAIGVLVIAVGLAAIFIGPRLHARIARGGEAERDGQSPP